MTREEMFDAGSIAAKKNGAQMFRFVSPDGRSTGWASIPEKGVAHLIAEATKVLGPKFCLETKQTTNVP